MNNLDLESMNLMELKKEELSAIEGGFFLELHIHFDPFGLFGLPAKYYEA